jgi:hypothetical protein
MQVDIVTLSICKEVCSTFHEGYGGGSIVSHEEVEQSPTPNDASQVLVCGTFWQIRNVYGALIMKRYPTHMLFIIVVSRWTVECGLKLVITGHASEPAARLSMCL